MIFANAEKRKNHILQSMRTDQTENYNSELKVGLVQVEIGLRKELAY